VNPTSTCNDACRRSVLRGAIVRALAAGLLTVGGCATHPAAPPKPPEPIKLLAVLPVSAPASESNSGFGSTQPGMILPIVVPVPSGSQDSLSPGTTAAAVAAGVVASAFIYSFRENSRKEREALTEALSHVNFDPAAEVGFRLAPALEQRQVRLVRIADPDIAAQVRAGRFDRLPADVDAILDVRVSESGYYSSWRAGGYSPMLQLTATLLAPAANADNLDEFSYYADWRNGGKDRRWVTTPKSLTFPTVDLLRANSAEARAGLARVVDQLVELMAEDLRRHATGTPRID
jgi:hypothetical protein